MTRRYPFRLCDLLEPVLNAAEADEPTLGAAICLVAEAMAALGVLIVDGRGRPLPGATDEMAVLGALNAHARDLVEHGKLDDALELADLMKRITRLRRTAQPR